MKTNWNIRVFSDQTAQKVVLWVSILFMVFVWLLLAGLLWAIFTSKLPWDGGRNSVAVIVTVLVLLLIPFQSVRSIRGLRSSK